MSWRIYVLENTLKINKKTAKKIHDLGHDEYFWKESDVAQNGLLSFDEDNMEHIDCLSQCEDIVDVLQKEKVKGKVLFCEPQSDGGGYDFWGHEFDGKGNYKRLAGKLVWE